MERPLTVPDTPAAIFIGSPTRDVLVRNGAAREVIGGAAFISALAARWAGSTAGIVARIPTALPPEVGAVHGRGGLHRGGLSCHSGSLPSFRIAYDHEDQATYTAIKPGLEAQLCAADIPSHWMGPSCRWLHIAGIGASSAQQLEVMYGIRHRFPTWSGTLSVGTCRAMIEADPDKTRTLLRSADYFFLNAEELSLLYPTGLPDDCSTIVVVTHGPDGVEVIGGDHAGHHPATATTVTDPTGAGDSFCGGFIGGMVSGHDAPVARGLRAAANVLEGFGAQTLSAWVAAQVEQRADHSPSAITALCTELKETAKTAAFDFTAAPHLPVGHPHALAMLCISTLHQYGFWTAAPTTGWQGPMLASLDGTVYKGSDFIWAAFARAAQSDPSMLSLDRMATEPDLFKRICTADDGTCPVPDLASHAALHTAHAMAMKRSWRGDYGALIDAANARPRPIAALLESLVTLPGYMADPLAKKANLLAIILAARPEGFIQNRDPESVAPIVDYHMMRLCLRTGLVSILDDNLRHRLETRQWVDTHEELAIRQATGRAILGVVEQTGLSVGAIDGLFFKLGRTVCLETEPARCEDCPLQTSCTRDVDLFQPVFRTTAY